MRQVLILIAVAALFCADGALLPSNDAYHDRAMDAEVRRVSESNADLKLIGHFQNKLYFSDFVSVPFHIASKLCSESGLRLLRVNYEENIYIIELVKNITASNPSRFWFWAGTSSNVTYIWEDGSPVSGVSFGYSSAVKPVLVLNPAGSLEGKNTYNLHLDTNITAMCYATLGDMPQI